MLSGLDISNHQGGAVDWDAVRAAGTVFAFAKASALHFQIPPQGTRNPCALAATDSTAAQCTLAIPADKNVHVRMTERARRRCPQLSGVGLPKSRMQNCFTAILVEDHRSLLALDILKIGPEECENGLSATPVSGVEGPHWIWTPLGQVGSQTHRTESAHRCLKSHQHTGFNLIDFSARDRDTLPTSARQIGASFTVEEPCRPCQLMSVECGQCVDMRGVAEITPSQTQGGRDDGMLSLHRRSLLRCHAPGRWRGAGALSRFHYSRTGGETR